MKNVYLNLRDPDLADHKETIKLIINVCKRIYIFKNSILLFKCILNIMELTQGQVFNPSLTDDGVVKSITCKWISEIRRLVGSQQLSHLLTRTLCHDILARPPYLIWLAKIPYLIRPRQPLGPRHPTKVNSHSPLLHSFYIL